MSLEDQKRKLRSQVLTIATRVGVHNPNDWDVFDRFMMYKSIKKKTLNLYTLEELQNLVKQFRGIEANYNKSSETKGTKAYFHKRGLQKPSLN
jgi:hypothetical protein